MYGHVPEAGPSILRLQAAYWRRQQRLATMQAQAIWSMVGRAMAQSKAAGTRSDMVSVDEMMQLTGVG